MKKTTYPKFENVTNQKWECQINRQLLLFWNSYKINRLRHYFSAYIRRQESQRTSWHTLGEENTGEDFLNIICLFYCCCSSLSKALLMWQHDYNCLFHFNLIYIEITCFFLFSNVQIDSDLAFHLDINSSVSIFVPLE